MRFKLTVPKLIVLMVMAMLFVQSLYAQEQESSPVILILGDSLSAAYNMEVTQSWPNLLQQRLEQDGYAWRVFNSSITGETTQGGNTRLPRLLEQQAPQIVLIELGGNDGLRGLPIEVTQRNLAEMINRSRESGAEVVLAEMRIPPNYGRTYTEKFNQTYSLLNQEYGITLLPFILQDIALQPGMMQPDGIHPSVEAQPLILDKVWAVLRPML